MQTPCLLSHVSTERILTFSMPAVVDGLGLDFVNLLVRLDEQFLRVLRIRDVVAGETADEAVAEFDDFVFAFVDGLHPDAVGRAAILLRG